MLKALKICGLIFTLFGLLIFSTYYFRHSSNREIYRKAQNNISEKEKLYLELYEYLKSSINDSFSNCGFTYRSGWKYLSFSLVNKNKEKNLYKDIPLFVPEISHSLNASYNSDSTKYMKVSLEWSNYKLDRTKLIYSPNLSVAISYLKKRGYKYYDSVEDNMDYENCIIKINEHWLLSFYKYKW